MCNYACLEAGLNTSTVALHVVGGDRKGSPESETVKLNWPLSVLTQLPISTLKRREGGSPSLALLLCSQAPKGRHRVSKL
jgi:hypothetical protein